MQITHETKGGTLKFGPAFDRQFLEEVFTLQQKIEDIGQSEGKGLEKICFAPMADSQKSGVSNCVVQSLFGYFSNSLEKFRAVIEDEGYEVNYLNTLDKCLV